MNKSFLQALLMLSCAGMVFAAPTPVGPLNFGGGVNYQASPTEIADNQSPDSCNCVSNQDGSLSKIFGTERFIDQARSSYPVTSLYRAYASTGTTSRAVLLAINGSNILAATDTVNPSWVTLSSQIGVGQHWSFVTMNNKVYMAGDGLTDNMKEYDIFSGSFTDIYNATSGSETIRIRAKYLTQKSNYLIMANVLDLTAGTTFYPSRFFFSRLNQPSSSTYNRFIDVRTNDGEEITGVGVNFDKTNFFKQSSIHELTFSILDLVSRGGDQSLAEVVRGFGLQSPRTLETDGDYYIIGSKDAIRIWDGGRKSRLNPADESTEISGDVKTLFDRLIKAGTYDRMVGKYYRRRNWYVLSYEDPAKFPQGMNNSVIIYDLRLKQWYPICGWLADSFATFDGDKGDLVYGDSTDGMVYYADLEAAQDNAPKNLVIDGMDNANAWQGVSGVLNKDFENVVEGTASLRIWVNHVVTNSSMTRMVSLPLGSWLDKTNTNLQDKLSFKFLTTSTKNLTGLRVDLEVNDGISNQFDANFTSYTFTDFSLIKSSAWVTLEVKLSSFPVRPDWTALDSELIPFAGTPNFYGIRFYIEGVGGSSVSIDDVRLTQNYNPVNFYRFTKLFNFGTVAFKTLGQVLLTVDRPADSTLLMDVYNDFGKKVNTKQFAAEIPKEILVMGWVSTASIAVIDDTDFSIIRSTAFQEVDFLPLNGVATREHIFFGDRTNDRLVKMKRNPFGVIASTFGSFGSGINNFNLLHQMCATEQTANSPARLFMVDMANQRIKEHSPDNLAFLRTVGSLGTTATSYHQATGISANNETVLVSDEGNYRFTKLDVSTLGIVGQRGADYNTIGDSSLQEDENFYYVFYNKISELSNDFQDIFLEKRDKGNLSLVTRTRVTTQASTALSTYAAQGDLALRGRYVYVTFTDNALALNPTFYIQKRLKSDFSLVREFTAPREILSVMGDSFSYKPSVKNEKQNLEAEGRYVQLKFYDEGKDNYIRLINQSFIINVQDITY